MTDIKLFALDEGSAKEIPGSAPALERSLQHLIEQNLETMLSIRLLGSEYSTGPKHGGRIDTLGIDENASPVIIEYKRATNQNVINQGLFYLDWLLDHRAEFKLLVLEKLGETESGEIDWTAPRLLCIASGFTRYDEHAVQQMNRNIELIRYRRFGENLLMLELVNTILAEQGASSGGADRIPGVQSKDDFGYVSIAGRPASRPLPCTSRASHSTWRRCSRKGAQILRCLQAAAELRLCRSAPE